MMEKKIRNLIKTASIITMLFFSVGFSLAQTFPCDNGGSLYFFRNTGGNGSLSSITNYTAVPVVTDMFNIPTPSHNALAANPLDNYLYYLDGTDLRKLDAMGGSTVVCILPFSSAYGCFDNLGRFCSINSNSLVVYDIINCTIVNSYSLPAMAGFIDIVYNVFDGFFYVGNLKVNSNGVVIANNITNFTPGGTWGGVAIGSNGLIYGLNSFATSQLSAINVISNTTFSVANITPGVTIGNSDMASFMCSSGISASVCAGSSATLSAANLFVLANPVYSIQPGGQVQVNPVFTVTPPSSTTYTLYVTGSNSVNATVTQSVIANVTVNAQPAVAPTVTQSTCSNSLNAVNLGLGFNPPAPTPNYSVMWGPVPPGILSPTQTTANNVAGGVTNVTVITSNGCSVTTNFSMTPAPSSANFTISPPGGIYFLTCVNTSVTLSASPVNYTYTWNSLSNSLTGTAVSFTPGMQGTYTVTGNNGIAGCNTTQTITIGQNTTAPTNSVSPASQTITCLAASPVTFSGTVTNPTVNIQHDWYSPLNPLPGGVPIATSNNTISILSGIIPPGVYTLVTTNLVNGCQSYKTVTISSLDAWPTFGINSSTNFSVGCLPLNQTTLSIINPVSTQTPPATCSFTFLPPSYAGTLAPGPYGVNTSTITTMPGTWTVIVSDNSNGCTTKLSVPIIQNTLAPNVSAIILQQTLTCYHPTLLATGTSSTPNTIIQWEEPIGPPLVTSQTIVVGPGTGPNTSTTSLTYSGYTVVVTNSINACISTSVVIINQNFKPPVSNPIISIGTPTAIYCTVASNPVILTTGSSTTTSGGGALAYVSNPCWQGPSSQTPLCGLSSYSCNVSGIYTLTIEDNYNGCTNSGTVNVIDKTQPPLILNPNATSTLDCGTNPTATLVIALSGTTTGDDRFLIIDYPAGAAFSPSSASLEDINPILSGTTNNTVIVNETGYFDYVVSNTLTGCQAYGHFNVILGKLTADFEPDPVSGYAPMDVSFQNLSATSSNSSGITSLWSFGNGASITTTTNIQVQTYYNSPGTYSVILIAVKGNCVDSIMRTVKMEMPSNMEVPNIFTPNGDGSNDVFFLKTASLGEISCVIIDRWGNRVYETTSNSGNISWDGKNFNGTECSPGVYFYIIKAKGKDDKAYESKGNVTLLR
jgi:gliding motility-associated-like protein